METKIATKLGELPRKRHRGPKSTYMTISFFRKNPDVIFDCRKLMFETNRLRAAFNGGYILRKTRGFYYYPSTNTLSSFEDKHGLTFRKAIQQCSNKREIYGLLRELASLVPSEEQDLEV